MPIGTFPESQGDAFALDKVGQRYGAGDLIAVAVRNPREESGASLVFAQVQEILTHDEGGMPYTNNSHHDPTARTIAPHEGGFAVLAQPVGESYASATMRLENMQPRVFDRVNNILALPGRTVESLLTGARLCTSR